MCVPDLNVLDQPISAGEVESWSGPGGAPAADFPAQSYFDVFVDVDMPPGAPAASPSQELSGPGALFNSVPLLVQNTNLTSFPPEVVYIHGMSTAVPIKFRTAGSSTDGTTTWLADEIFGLLRSPRWDFADFDSTIDNYAILPEVGSSITSVSKFFVQASNTIEIEDGSLTVNLFSCCK